MSAATQANDRLAQLVSITSRIENLLIQNNKPKEGGAVATNNSNVGNIIKEASAIGGMSLALSKLILATSKLDEKSGDRLASFIGKMTDAIKDAANSGITSEQSIELSASFLIIATGASKYMKAMALSAILGIPAMIGTVFFGSSVRLLFTILKGVTGMSEEAQSSIAVLMSLGKSALLFALAMVGIAVLSVPFAFGVIVFGLAVTGLLKAFSLVSKGDSLDNIKDLLSLGKAAVLFALAMVGIAILSVPFAFGVIVFGLAVTALLKVFSLVQNTNVDSIKNLLSLAKGAALFALTMVLISYFAKEFAIGTIVFTLAVSAVIGSFALLGNFSKQITASVIQLRRMTMVILPFALILAGIGYFAPTIALGAITISLSILAVGGATALLGMMDKGGNLKRGAIGLFTLAPALIAFSAALYILGSVPGSPTDLFIKLGAIAASIVGLGLAAFVLGQAAVFPFVLLGASDLISLGASLVVFSTALYILSKADFNKEKTDNLTYAISELGLSLAKLGLLALPAAIGAAALIPMSVALLPLSLSLYACKKIGWTETDGESLKNALYSVVTAFSNAFKDIGLTDMIQLLAVIPMIAMMGNSLVSLASGVKAMATLTFIESEYDKKTGKLIPKREVKLTDAEIQAVGPNVASILNALAEPLANFGKWAKEGSYTFGPFTLGSGYMEYGIEAASKLGNFVGSLAEGVYKMAKLEIVSYEVVGRGTKNAKLVPKETRKLGTTDFKDAAQNTATILNVLAEPLTNFGKWAKEGTYVWGPFTMGSGYLEYGIDAASKIGNFVGSLADGIYKMAKLEITTYKIYGRGTKDAKLIPDQIIPLKKDDITKSIGNVNQILTAIVEPLSKFGEAYSEGSWLFDNDYVKLGIEGIVEVTDPISKLADMIIKLGSGQITENKLVNNKIVPGAIKSFKDILPAAKQNVNELLTGVVGVVVSFGKLISDNSGSIESAKKFLPELNDITNKVLKISEDYASITNNFGESQKLGIDPGIIMTNFSKSIETSISRFNEKSKMGIDVYREFTSITRDLVGLTTPLEKLTKVFNKFGKDIEFFVKTWKSFSNKDADNFKTYANSLKTIADINPGKLKENIATIKEYTTTAIEKATEEVKGAESVATADTKEKQQAVANKQGAAAVEKAKTEPAPSPPAASKKNTEDVYILNVQQLWINGKLQTTLK